MRNDYLKNKKIQLTETQVKYIIDNHQREPMLINRVVNISKFLGEELQRQEELSFIPERVLIEYILAENEKSYHIYGKLKKNHIDSKMYWLPKTQVLDDPYFEELNVDVNFEKYNDILKKYDKTHRYRVNEGIKNQTKKVIFNTPIIEVENKTDFNKTQKIRSEKSKTRKYKS